MKAYFLTTYLIIVPFISLLSQNHDQTWVLGKTTSFGYASYFGLLQMKFETNGEISYNRLDDSSNFFVFETLNGLNVMSNAAGELIYYSNGRQIRDKNNQIPPGGDTLNFTMAQANLSYLHGYASMISLPMPGKPDEYMLITTTIYANYGTPGIGIAGAPRIYYHRIRELSESIELLEVNNTLLEGDTLAERNLSAIRHANGRDWWIFVPKLTGLPGNNNRVKGIQVLYLGTEGLSASHYYEFDEPILIGVAQHNFSTLGDKFIIHTANHMPENIFVIMDFDRCTGMLENSIKMELPGGGVRFVVVSPNNRFVYAGSYTGFVYQFDLTAANVFGSQVIVGYVPYISVVNGHNGAAFAQLAPDGKIYLTRGASGMHDLLHVIHYPDVAGIACGFEYQGHQIPINVGFSFPNFPNYCLGALEGSPADTLGLPYDYCKVDSVVSVQEVTAKDIFKLQIHPNPSTGVTMLSLPESGRLSVYDLQGRLIQQTVISSAELELNYKGNYTLHTTSLPAGMYVVVHYGESGEVYRGKLAVVP